MSTVVLEVSINKSALTGLPVDLRRLLEAFLDVDALVWELVRVPTIWL